MQNVAAQGQISQMVNFILNEAKDKAAEIELVASKQAAVEREDTLLRLKQEVEQEFESKALAAQRDATLKVDRLVRERNIALYAARKDIWSTQVKKSAADRLLQHLKANPQTYEQLLAHNLKGVAPSMGPTTTWSSLESDRSMVKKLVYANGLNFAERSAPLGAFVKGEPILGGFLLDDPAVGCKYEFFLSALLKEAMDRCCAEFNETFSIKRI